MSDETKKGPLGELTSDQRTQLGQIEYSIGLEGVTVSFSFDGERDGLGRRKSAFNNARAAPRVAGTHWTRGEAQVVRCILSKDVVLATYRDAVFRGILSKAGAAEEVRGILSHYDRSIAKLMKQLGSDDWSVTAGTNCEECGEPQFEAPDGSGITCPNGHGGAGSEPASEPTPEEDEGMASMFGDLP